MHLEIIKLIDTLTNLTTGITILTAVLILLVLVDCGFLYRRVTTFGKKSRIAVGKPNDRDNAE